MPIAFDEVASLLHAGRVEQLADLMVSVDEADRRALGAPLKDFTLQRNDNLFDPALSYPEHQRIWREDWETLPQRQDALRVAGAACLPRAADIVTWLRLGELRWAPSPGAAEAVLRVLQAPGRPSAAIVGRDLARRLRPASAHTQWPIAEALLRATGQTPAPTEAVVVSWLRGNELETDRLRADPWTPALLPQVFQIPRIGAALDDEHAAIALARLCAEGGYDRASMLDGCLLRLAEGDRPGALRPFAALHRHLAPTAEEIGSRAQQYLGMLASPHSTVAGLALDALRTVGLGAETVTEAAYAVLPRTEKKLVRAQLSWMDAALAREPDPELFAALLTGLSHDAPDLVERTLTIAARHLPAIGAAGRDLLADAAASLEGDLRRRAGTTLGVATPVEAAAPVALAPSPVAAPMPPPFGSVDELAAAASVLVQPGQEWSDPGGLELVLDGLVRFAREDRAALAGALRAIPYSHGNTPLVSVLSAVVHGQWSRWHYGAGTLAAPFAVLAERIAELGRAIPFVSPPGLLATPATVDGRVDPARMLALLESAERDSWQPRPYDLSQALLRLPRQVEPAIIEAAARLTTPAGRTFAEWLRGGGVPDPVMVTHEAPCAHRWGPRGSRTDARQRVITFEGADPGLRNVPPELFQEPAADWYSIGAPAWPMVLPGHPEIIAAHLAEPLADTVFGEKDEEVYEALLGLVRSPGPFGPATALCLAHGLTAGRTGERLTAVDAFLHLAARGLLGALPPDAAFPGTTGGPPTEDAAGERHPARTAETGPGPEHSVAEPGRAGEPELPGGRRGTLDGAMVGRELAGLLATDEAVLKRVVAALTEALRAGAPGAVWAVTAVLIPAVLSAPSTPPGTPDLLALAESAAAATRTSGHLPEVAAVASRTGRSRLITEAARLTRTLDANRRRVLQSDRT